MSLPKIDKTKCIGCGLCSALAASTFKLNEDEGKSEVVNPAGDDETAIQMALDSCPTQAISWDA